MANLKIQCIEFAKMISNRTDMKGIMQDAKEIYDWVKDCPSDEQSLPASKCGGKATILITDSKSDSV